jgi:hypothetical protein
MPGKVYSEPSSVEAVEGAVPVDGPDGVSISMTPEAALTTSDRLLDGAMVAQGQRVEARRDEKRRGPPGTTTEGR